jgi:hypothetical protein
MGLISNVSPENVIIWCHAGRILDETRSRYWETICLITLLILNRHILDVPIAECKNGGRWAVKQILNILFPRIGRHAV